MSETSRRQTGQASAKARAVAALQAVGDPGEARLAVRAGEALQRRQFGEAVWRIGHGLERAQALQRGGGIACDRVVTGVGHRRDRHRLGVLARRLDALARGDHPAFPGRRRRPTVVQHQQQRSRRRLAGAKRMPDRAGHGENDRGGDGKAQQQQPGRRVGGRLVRRLEVEDELQRGKRHATGTRRRDAQQHEENRQTGEGDERERHREGERQAKHQAALASSCIRRDSSASDAGRSVR